MLVFNLTTTGPADGYIQKMNFSPTGVLETIAENTFSVYPNPSSQSLVISHLSLVKERYELKIVNTMGRQVYSSLVHEPITKVDVSKLECGIYFVHITSASFNEMMVRSKKLVIE